VLFWKKTLERGLIDQRRLRSHPFSRGALPPKATVRRGYHQQWWSSSYSYFYCYCYYHFKR